MGLPALLEIDKEVGHFIEQPAFEDVQGLAIPQQVRWQTHE